MRLILLLGALAAICANRADAAAQMIRIKAFAALPAMQKPVLSLDGHHIAAISVGDGKTALAVIDADHPEAPPRMVALGKADVVDIDWAGNQRLLLQVRGTQIFDRLGAVPFTRLFAMDLATGESRFVDRGSRGFVGGDVLYTDPTGAWALVASQDNPATTPSVKRIDLATGKGTLVEKPRPGVWSWYADARGFVRAGVSYEGGTRYGLWYRDQPDEKLTHIHGKLPKDDDSRVDRLIFRGTNNWVVTNARTGRFGLYRFDAQTATIGEPVFENPDVDLDQVRFDQATGDIIGITYQDDSSRVFWIDPDMKALQAKLDRALPDSVNLPVGWSLDRMRILVWSGAPESPGEYFLLDRSNLRMHPVIDVYPDIAAAQLSPTKPIRYRTRDGLLLRGYLTLPRGRDAKGLPLILLPHGGPFARDNWGYDSLVQFLANRGYAVLQPEFRGSTGLGKDFVAKGYGEIGKKMQDDLDDGVDWLARSGQIDPKRVCIVGMSYGGYAAMWGAIRNPERYRCAASWAGPSDLPAMMRYDREQFGATRYFSEFRKQYPSDSELADVSPIRFADRLKVPLFIAQGEDDTTVPPEQSHRMLNALTKAGANVTSVFYKDSKHNFGSSADHEDWLRRLESFLAKYNPA
jgi:dipeptidyl aminopeptidase/acylaminoacyl peptidase